MRRHAALLAALALAALHGVAPADEPPPVLRELKLGDQTVTEVPQGGVVTVMGEALHECPPLRERVPGEPPRTPCRHDELSVTLNGVKVPLVFDCRRQHLTIIVPQETRPGRYALVVTIRGRGSAAIDLEVVEPPPPPPDEPDPPVILRITRFELVRQAGEVRVEFIARTERLPDGASVQVSLSLDQRVLDTRLVPVEDGVLRTTFGPFARRLPAGVYAVTTLFELSHQPAPLQRALLDALTPAERPFFERVERREFLQVGTFTDLDRERAEVRVHYLALVDDLDRLHQELDRWRLAQVLARLRPTLGVAPPPLELGSFTRWLDVRLVPELERVRRTDVELDAQYAYPLEPRARAGLERLAQLLDRWSADLAGELGVRQGPAPPAPVPPREEFARTKRSTLRAAGVKEAPGPY